MLHLTLKNSSDVLTNRVVQVFASFCIFVQKKSNFEMNFFRGKTKPTAFFLAPINGLIVLVKFDDCFGIERKLRLFILIEMESNPGPLALQTTALNTFGWSWALIKNLADFLSSAEFHLIKASLPKKPVLHGPS